MQLRTEEENVQTTSEENMRFNNVQQEELDYSWSIQDDAPYVSTTEPKKSRAEYYKSIERHKERSNITVASIIVYVMAAINILLGSMILDGNIAWFDIILLVVLALGVQFKQSRACACVLLGYSILNSVITLILNGRMSGILLIWAGYLAVKGTFDFNKEWNWYNQQ
ncbi:MAG: hypothetical protein E7264_07725 [Lachnospiraceae bacterium]|nr:hypothetical protein [Lachnospiraceae bacterium]